MARRQRKTPIVRKTNYGQLQHALGPQSVLSEDNVAYIHENALRVLQDLGIFQRGLIKAPLQLALIQ